MSTPVVESKIVERASNVRLVGCAFVTLVTLTAYLDRAAFSVTASPLMEALHITPIELGYCMTIFSMGYGLLQMPSTVVIHRLGAHKTIALALVVWSIFTALTGVAGLVGSLVFLGFVRFCFGMAESPIYPAANNFNAHWFPKEERARANSWMNNGGFMGNIVGPPIVVGIVSLFGWQSSYYVCGLIGIIVAVVWYKTMRNHPSEHPGVNEKELALITTNSDIAVEKNIKVPWGVLLRQRSFWAIGMGYFGTLWTVQFFTYWLPYYLQAARNISFKGLGFYASLPWVAIVICVFIAGTLSDWLLKKGYSRFWSRNMICVAGLCVSAAGLVGTANAQSINETLVYLCIAVGFVGFAQTTAWPIATDIGKELTSAVSSWMNTWGFVAASLNPLTSPLIAKSYGWDAVLIFNACIMVVGIIGYLSVKSDQPLKIA